MVDIINYELLIETVQKPKISKPKPETHSNRRQRSRARSNLKNRKRLISQNSEKNDKQRKQSRIRNMPKPMKNQEETNEKLQLHTADDENEVKEIPKRRIRPVCSLFYIFCVNA